MAKQLSQDYADIIKSININKEVSELYCLSETYDISSTDDLIIL